MLTEIRLTNFKCFKEETSIELSRFNLFTGVNGAGKSTALQALLLMRQSYEYNPYTEELVLNGSCVNLGSFHDVKNKSTLKNHPIFFNFLYCADNDSDSNFSMRYTLERKQDELSLIISKVAISLKNTLIKIKDVEERNDSEREIIYDSNTGVRYLYGGGDGIYIEDGSLYNYQNADDIFFSFKLNNPTLGFIARKKSIEGKSHLPEVISEFNNNIDNIHFVSADRIGPQEFYKKSNLSYFSHVGVKGEFAINLLNNFSQELVNERLCLGEDARTLLTQTEAWLSKILNADIKLKITPLRVNILELLINDFKPSNVGFGYSSILPIIVTGLIAKPGEKIIIENPEIHLHPKAQSALIEFLIKVSNTGVQIFIESHSDHVLNALRIATKNKLITPEDVNILFFGLEDGNSKIIKPTLDENGRIDQWPEYFFDETAKSLASLAAGQRIRVKAPKAED